MNESDGNSPESVSVVCSVCKTRFEAPLRDEATEVMCPDCFSPVNVPSAAHCEASRPVDYRPAEPGVYSIAAESGDERPQRPPKPAKLKVARIACRHCGAALTPEVRDRAYNITCPQCLEVTEVPARSSEPKKRKRRRAAARPAATTPAESVWSDATPGAAEGPSVYDAMASIRREPLPEPPTWTFFSSVFQIPWRADAVLQWTWMSVGCFFVGIIVAMIHWIVADGILIMLPFFVLPAVWMTIWTGSFVVSSFLTVLEETANGNDRITGWNDGGWKDAAAESIPAIFLASLAGTASYIIARGAVAAWGADAYWPAFGIAWCATFPFILLSSLQAGSVWVPITPQVLKSVFTNAAHWFLFYALMLLVAAAYAVPVWAGLRSGSWFTTLMLTAPLLAAVVLIAARLMGRLAWRTLVRDGHEESESPESPVRPERDEDARGRTDRKTVSLTG